MKKLLSVFLICCLVGCSSESTQDNEVKDEPKEVTTVCKYEDAEYVIYETLVSIDDKLIKQTTENEIELNGTYFDSEKLTMAAYEFKETADAAGVEYSFSLGSGVFYEEIIVDYENTDLDKLISAGFVIAEDGATYVSLEETVDLLIGEGYTCE